MKHSQQNQYKARHNGCHCQPGYSKILNYTVYNNYKCSCRASYLHRVTAKGRHEKAANNSCYQPYRRTHT